MTVRTYPDYPEGVSPSDVMEVLTGDNLIDITWSVLEGGDPFDLALEYYEDLIAEDES